MWEEQQESRAPASLAPGEYFSAVRRHWRGPDLVLSELGHARPRRFPRHSHKMAYFSLLLSGDYSEQVGRRTLVQRPMGLTFHPAGIDHRDEIGHDGGRFFNVEIGTRWTERLREETNASLAWTALPAGEPLWLAVRLYRELRAGDACSGLAIEGLVLELLAAAARSARVAETRPPRWLVRVEALLRAGFRERLTLDRLAAEAGVHPVYLARAFRRFHGRTPGNFLQDLRVRHVCAGLVDPEIPLADLALDAGFADQSHCTRVFRRLTGKTPGAFRAALQDRPPGSAY